MSLRSVILGNDLTIDDKDGSPTSRARIALGGTVGEHTCLRPICEVGKNLGEGQITILGDTWSTAHGCACLANRRGVPAIETLTRCPFRVTVEHMLRQVEFLSTVSTREQSDQSIFSKIDVNWGVLKRLNS